MSISLFTWNIEQFGATRSQYANRRERVCDLIAREAPDVATIIELKTTKTDVAIDIAKKLLAALEERGKGDYRFIITHSNFLEIYLFLYDSSRLTPWVIPSGKQKIYTETELASLELEAADGRNSTRRDSTTLERCFPLLDYPGREQAHRPLGAAFFQERNTGQFYAVVAWHNEAGYYARKKGVEITSDRKPMKNLGRLAGAGMVTSGTLSVTRRTNLGSIPTTITNVVITGDFNVNFSEKYTAGYAAYLPFGAKQGRVAVAVPTYLNKNVLNGKLQIFTSCYDNFLLSPGFFQQHQINAHRWEFLNWFNSGGARFLKDMIDDSDLTDVDALADLAVDAVKTGFLAAAKKTSNYGYVPMQVRRDVAEIISEQPIRKWWAPGVRKTFAQEVTTALKDHVNTQLIAETLLSWLDDQRADLDDTLATYSLARKYPTALSDAQKTGLVINILSDHVPLMLRARG
jgi:hypothetical protein